MQPQQSSNSGASPANEPAPPKQTSRHEKFNLFSLLFTAFMLLVGGGILITQLTGLHSNNNDIRPNSVPLVSGKTATKAITSFVTATPIPQIKVYVTGEVKNPGIYIMQSDDRLVDALELAGGTTDQSDISQLDLAQRVRDEMRINVPRLIVTPISSPTVTNATPTSIIISSSSNPTSVSLPNNAPASTTRTTSTNSSKIGLGSGVKVNVNVADVNELERLPGIGQTLAQRLVDYRTQHGAFHTVDDLHHIQGFTKSVVDKIKDLITF